MTRRGTLSSLAVLAAVLLSSAARAADAPAAALDDRNPVRVQLVADVDPVAPGEEFRLGALFEIAPGWHIYWIFPGNTGQPTVVDFRVDERLAKVLEPRFPVPAVFDAERPADLSFGYANSALVLATALVFDLPPGGELEFAVEASWLACKRSCVRGRANPRLRLKVADAGRPSAWATRFADAEAALPTLLPATAGHLRSARLEPDGSWVLHFSLPGLAAVERFTPRWPAGGACKVVDYGLEPDEAGRPGARLTLRGANCLPGAGGVAWGRASSEPAEGPARPFVFQAAGPPGSAPAPSEPPSVTEPQTTVLPAQGAGESVWWMLLLALLGGMLLNIMPCVIPVVMPKILHVVRTAQKTADPVERRRLLWSNSLAYTAGVLATLLALGLVVVVLRAVGHEVGWGFQFQNPWFLVFMISLLLVLGLGMLHVYPMQRACHTEDLKGLRRWRRRSPLVESFLTGLLVTFLGTPCTAPLLGPALGYAFTAPAALTLTLMLAVGLGLSSPFLLLGFWTGWTRLLPERVTGAYDRVMRGMAFLLFATAVWLFSVLADAYGLLPAVNLLWFLLALAAATWLWGLLVCDSDGWGRRLLRLLPLAATVALVGVWLLGFPGGARDQPLALHSTVGIDWQPFSEARVAELRRSGKAVFVDFTAEWCMNCKANERLVIETHATRELFTRLGVVTLKADNTRFDPVNHAWLKRFGRAGVPMYLVFPPCAPDEQIKLLPEILTSNGLQQALEKSGPSRTNCD